MKPPFEKFIIPGGGGLFFGNNGPECLFMLYLIIVFNNVLGYFSDMDLTTDTWAYKISCLMFSN